MSLLVQIGELVQNPTLGLARQVGQLFFPREYKLLASDDSFSLSIDTVARETHESTSSVTTYAVEQGADMSDHYVADPAVFRLAGVISDITTNEITDYAIPSLPLNGGGSPSREESGTRSQLAWRELKRIQQSGQFVDFNSNLQLYENMLITRLSVDQENSTSRAIFFEMTLKQILIGSLETVAGVGVFSVADPTKGKTETAIRNGNLVRRGKQVAAPVDTTGLARAADYFGL